MPLILTYSQTTSSGLLPFQKMSCASKVFPKQLEYMSYGLPVLTPEWRHDPKLAEYSIDYNEANFLDKIREYASRQKWQQASDLCRSPAQLWSWESNLTHLLGVLYGGDAVS
jgi:hypothetical protein